MMHMIEVHVGLPKGTDFTGFKNFEVSHVFETQPGPSITREYEGHAVDGELGAILTTWPQLSDLETFTKYVAAMVGELSGARLEYELIGRAPAADISAFLSNLLSGLERVPAPRFEQHLKVRNGKSAQELLSAMGNLLVGYEHFELTVFGPEDPKAIVTVAANELDHLTTQAIDIGEVLRAENVSMGPVEQLLGAWRPQ